MGSVDPRSPQNQVALQSRPHRTLACFFAAPIDAQWGDRILLSVGLGFASVEDIIRRNVNERGPGLVASSGNVSRSRAIDRPSRLRLALGTVDGRIGCEVDCSIGALFTKDRANERALGDV